MSTNTMRVSRVLACALLFLFSISLAGQNQEPLTYYSSSKKVYDIGDGMIDRCVSNSFVTNDGRLYIIPCANAQSAHNVHIYQFDGFNSYKQRPEIIPDSGQWSMITCHISATGLARGYLLETSDNEKTASIYFELDTKEMSWETRDAPTINDTTVNIRGILEYEDEVYLLGQLPGRIFMFVLKGHEWIQVSNVRAPGLGGILNVELSFMVENDQFWLETWNGTVYNIDANTFELKTFLGSEINLSRIPESNRFIKRGSHQVIYAINSKGKLYLIDAEEETQEPFKPYWDKKPFREETQHSVFDDGLGQLLYVRNDQDEELQAWLVDTNGIVHNYTPPLLSLGSRFHDNLRKSNIVSSNFTEGFFVTGILFAAIEVTSHEAVQAFPGKATRGFMTLPNGDMRLSNGSLFDGSNLRSIKAEKDQFSFCYESINVGSDIVEVSDNVYIFRSKLGVIRYDTKADTCQLLTDKFGSPLRYCFDGDKSIYTVKSNQLVSLDVENGDTEVLADTTIKSFVNSLLLTENDQLYIGTSQGLYLLDRDKRKLRYIDLGGARFDQQVLSIYESYDDKLWIGTYGSGLKIYDPIHQSVRVITTDEGLSSNIVASIIEDEDGDLWVGTYYGITIYDRDANLMGYLYEESGLVDNECNRWSAFLLEDNHLFIGTPSGFSLIDATAVKHKISKTEKRWIYPTTIEYNDVTLTEGEEVFLDALKSGLEIPAENRSLQVSYGFSSYAAPEGNSYAYKLDRQGSDWNYIGGLRELSLTDLPIGKYDLLISGSDVQGRVSINTIRIPLQVNRFFYQNWWFYFICAIPFIVFGLIWVRRQKSERLYLEKEVVKRTETIRHQTEELKQLDKMKTRLYTNITHEFRTPLTVIRGLVDNVGEDDKAPELIKRNTDSLLNLVNQMLDLRKLESGNLTLDLVQDDIIAFLQYIGESFRTISEIRHQQFHFLSERNKLVTDFDPDKLTRVVSNLLSNAIKFTPEGGDIYLQVDSSKTDDDNITIKVTDTGVGIPAEEQKRIFDRFYQVDDTTTRRGEGTGIGLTLVSELLKLMDGTISVFSTPGKGTTFVMTVPQTNDAPITSAITSRSMTSDVTSVAKSSAPVLARQSAERLDDRYRVLIVEDNPDVVHYIGRCLEDDYNLIIALDGKEGVEKAFDEIPDMIVSDVMMPEMDGFDLCQTLKQDERTSHIPIILLTAKADHESRIKGLSRGADAYLAKPFNKKELLTRIDKLIEQRHALQKRYALAEPIEPSNEEATQLEDAFIMRFRTVLIANLSDEDFGIDEVCSALHLGRTQVHNKVKALTGKSTSIYMRAIRLAEAKTLLSEKEMNISEVAFAVGFSDPKYFAKVFKKEFGQTPTDWIQTSDRTIS